MWESWLDYTLRRATVGASQWLVYCTELWSFHWSVFVAKSSQGISGVFLLINTSTAPNSRCSQDDKVLENSAVLTQPSGPARWVWSRARWERSASSSRRAACPAWGSQRRWARAPSPVLLRGVCWPAISAGSFFPLSANRHSFSAYYVSRRDCCRN